MKQLIETQNQPAKRSPLAMKCTVNRAALKPNSGTSGYVAVDLTPSAAAVGRTDGKDFVTLAQGIREGGITITAIGIGTDYNDSLLQKIAESGGGLWHHIKDGQGDLPQIFQAQAEQMAGTIVAHPELKVSIMPGSELADAYSVKPVLNRLPRPKFDGQAFTVPLRDLIAGEEQTLGFRIGVPARPAGKAALLRFSLVEVAQSVEVTFTDDPRLWNAETNPYPRTLLSSAEATVLMQRAVQTKEASALQKAETIMRTLATDAGAATALRANATLNEVVTTMRDAQATVARSGLQLSESAKKEFLQATTVIGKKKPKR